MQKKNTLWFTVLALSLSLALIVPAFAQSRDVGSKSPSPSSPASSGGTSTQPSQQAGKALSDKANTAADQTLNQRIRQALSGDMVLVAVTQKIQLNTDNGEVTLHGSVATEKEKADVATKIQQVAGVKKVNNQLQMAPN